MSWRERVKEIKLQLVIVYQAVQDKRLPWYVRVIPWLVLAYALSPIDLIPDFIPVLGYLDDLLLLPLGIILALKFIPETYKAEYRAQAVSASLPPLKAGIIIVAAVWLIIIVVLILVWRK
ncbi:MAG: YkvA family protein [Methylocystaceae bacterium]